MDERFNTLLSIILVPQIIDLIIQKEKMTEDGALEAFYQSKTYELLSNEESKLWHLSPLAVYFVWKNEKETGELVIPEGQ